jgi:hypothetical protein
MSKGIKQADGTLCYAKNPDTCKNHGSQSPFDLFEAAMAKKDIGGRLNAQVMYKKHMYTQLAAQFQKDKPAATQVISGFRDYSSQSVEALKEFNEEYQQASTNWSDDQRTAIKDYTGLSYKNVNKFLRNKEEWLEQAKPQYKDKMVEHVNEVIEQLDSVMDQASNTKSRTVYRNVSQDTTKAFTSSEEFAHRNGWIEGKEVDFPSYLSTSYDPHYMAHQLVQDESEHTDVVFVMETNKGVPVDMTALDAKGHTYVQDAEREILLPRSMRFRVSKVTRSVGFEPYEENNNSRAVFPLTVYLEEV